MSATIDLLLPGSAADLPGGLADYLDTLSRVASTLQLSDTRPASLAAAARQVAARAQEAQDREEAAFEAGCQLAAQLAAAQSALTELQRLAAQLDASAGEQQAATEEHVANTRPNLDKAAKYRERHRQLEQQLEQRGLCSEIKQARLQAAGKEHGRVAAELARLERELEHYGGLPAEMAAAKAAMRAKREELARLRRRLQEDIEGME